ncbi:MAG TPA: VOC family protein [Caulobacterales bacterium]|nr:VOC family protein [Caulobacterales bacterium]
MRLNLDHIGQISFAVSDTDQAERFYEDVVGLRKLYRYGDLVFFDCAGVRLMLGQSSEQEAVERHSALYFKCADIALAQAELQRRGAVFDGAPHRVAAMDDHDLWMSFFHDPDGHVLALMCEAPRGYQPAEAPASPAN